MSKWKCGICGDEFENYHAQGFDDIIYCPLCYFKEEYKRTNEMLKMYKKQLQQKENIIKEAINYIKEESWFCYKDNEEVIDRLPVEKLLEILGDKNE